MVKEEEIETKFFPGQAIYGTITPKGVTCIFNDEKIVCGNDTGDIIEVSRYLMQKKVWREERIK